MKSLALVVSLFSLIVTSCGNDVGVATSTLNAEKIRWTYKSSFTESEKKLIKDAMGLLRVRISSAKVWECANSNSKRWMVRNSGQSITDHDKYRPWHRDNMFALMHTPEFKINVDAYNEQNNSMGRAFVGGFVRSEILPGLSLVPMYNLKGDFTIELNKKNLNSKYWKDSPATWAGVIAHEMLHQMGYSHDDGKYDDDMFITVFGDCLERNGKYVSRKTGFGLTEGETFPIPD